MSNTQRCLCQLFGASRRNAEGRQVGKFYGEFSEIGRPKVESEELCVASQEVQVFMQIATSKVSTASMRRPPL